MNNMKKIILTGGGTLGSVIPLLAISDKLKDKFEFIWLGTKHGPEKEIIETAGLQFMAIPAGKIRRYWDWKNFRDIFLFIAGFFKSFLLLQKNRPNLVITAGSYAGVPVVIAAKFLGIKVLVHQLDYLPGLANKIGAKFADKVAVTWEKSLKDFGSKAIWTGSMVRSEQYSQTSRETNQQIINEFGLNGLKPIVLVVGGGTGANGLNNLIAGSINYLKDDCEILHLTGKGKKLSFAKEPNNYRQIEFLNQPEMAKAYAVADVVVSRAGMSAILELAALKKPTIIIPMPNSHQELNARVLRDSSAALVLFQDKTSPEMLSEKIKKILSDKEYQESLEKNIGQIVKINSQELIELVKSMANI